MVCLLLPFGRAGGIADPSAPLAAGVGAVGGEGCRILRQRQILELRNKTWTKALHLHYCKDRTVFIAHHGVPVPLLINAWSLVALTLILRFDFAFCRVALFFFFSLVSSQKIVS